MNHGYRATLTAILFVISKFLLGIYLGGGAAGSAYGAEVRLLACCYGFTMPLRSCFLAPCLCRFIPMPTVPY